MHSALVTYEWVRRFLQSGKNVASLWSCLLYVYVALVRGGGGVQLWQN